MPNGLFSSTGSIFLTGDWTNNGGNAAFIPGSQGDVLFIGGNQNISGSDVTNFYDLTLKGIGIKQLLGIDTKVSNTLNLNDRELSTETNTAFVSNVNPAAITLSTGFVSSLGDGALSRNTASTAPYLFPVGTSARYRPVVITPSDADANTYAVRMAEVDATAEGYSTSQKEPAITNINPLFYHRIRRDSGLTAADLTIYYDQAADGYFGSIGHWQNLPQWEDIKASSSAGGYGLTGISKSNWNDFTLHPFALINLKNECRDKIFIPSAFSPNADGENDVLYVRGIDCLENLSEFVIFNRWGEKVFETTNPANGWDGFYKGQLSDAAVFTYYLKGTLIDGSGVTKSGNITLVR